MADSDFFTDFNKELTIEDGRILLEFKKCDYNLELYLAIYPVPSPIRAANEFPSPPRKARSKRYISLDLEDKDQSSVRYN